MTYKDQKQQAGEGDAIKGNTIEMEATVASLGLKNEMAVLYSEWIMGEGKLVRESARERLTGRFSNEGHRVDVTNLPIPRLYKLRYFYLMVAWLSPQIFPIRTINMLVYQSNTVNIHINLLGLMYNSRRSINFFR